MATDVDLSQLAIDRGKLEKRLRRRPHLMTRYVLPALLVGGFLALVGWSGRDYVFSPQPVTVVPVMASHVQVKRDGMPLFEAAGWIEPRPTPVRVAALAPGVVEQLLVVEDQPVKAGEPVAELIKADAQLACDRALANLRLQQSALDQARAAEQAANTRFAQPVHLEAALGEAEAALAQIETQWRGLPFEIRRAEADLDFARKDYEGKQAAGGAISGRAIDRARSQWQAAQAMVEELREREASLAREREAFGRRRDALKTQLDLLADERRDKDEGVARVAAAAARVEQARVAVAEAKLRLDRTTVRAPIDGRVYQLVAYPGSTLTAGMGQAAGADASTVVTLYRPDMLQVRVDVRFEDIPKVTLAQPVRIENPALEAPLSGRVLFVSSEADIQKNTLQVKVAIDRPPPVFKPEMLVDVTFLAPKDPAADAAPTEALLLYVPQQLIGQDDGGTFVWVADQSAGVVRKARIETGGTGNNGLVCVTSGLTISSRIIASGYEGLADGDRIRVTGEHADLALNSSPSPTPDRRPGSRLPNERK